MIELLNHKVIMKDKIIDPLSNRVFNRDWKNRVDTQATPPLTIWVCITELRTVAILTGAVITGAATK